MLCESALCIVGAVVVVYWAARLVLCFVTNVRPFILAPRCRWFRTDLTTFGSWAVVTGATDGMGKEFATELARRGLNVVLVSRSADKLRQVADLIESDFGVKTRCIAVDFRGGLDIYNRIKTDLSDIPVGILINNVGMTTPFPAELCEDEANSNQMLDDVINVNCKAVTFMTKMVLPDMVKRGRGLIVNVGSQAGCEPIPTFAVYAATKSYVDMFTRAVSIEYRSKGIQIQSLLPGFVSTNMSKMPPSLVVPTASDYVRTALSTVGLKRRTTGWWMTSLSGELLMTFPVRLREALTVIVMQHLRDSIKEAERTCSKSQ